MHIQKNMCKSVYGTFLQEKNGVKTRKDLMKMKIKDKLVPHEMIKIPCLQRFHYK